VRTRFFDSLRNREIEDFLARRDVIFLPVGTIEMHGEMPVGCEHVLPLAVASAMAEAADGLVLPGLHYFYPGATATGRGTIQVLPSVGTAYLRAVCHSLLRQGFRRQVLVSAHGPAEVTIAPMVREFFEETKCSILYVDLEPYIGGCSWDEFNRMLWGAYDLLGRLDEIPRDQLPMERTFPPQIITGRFHFGAYYAEASDHGWGPDHELSTAERRTRADQGRAMIEALVRQLDPAALVEKMQQLDEYLKRDVLPRYRDLLP
jgi:creatinine amidohydrolase